MLIAIPVNEGNMNASISSSFGRAPFFLIYDKNTNKSKFLDNSAVMSQGGAGIKASQIIVDNEVKILITPQCGKNAAEVLTSAEVKIYKSEGNSIQKNLEAFSKNQLSVLEEIHDGFHNH